MYVEALETASDLVVASRFCDGGDIGHLQPPALGALTRLHARRHVLFPTPPLAGHRPLSGFFMVRRDARRPRFACARRASRSCSRSWSERRSCGCQRSRSGSASATPARRRPRRARRSAIFSQLARLELGRALGALRPLRRRRRHGPGGQHGCCSPSSPTWSGIYYVAAAILATQGSTLWNFCLTELWVFADRDHRRTAPAPRGDVLRGQQRCARRYGCRCCSRSSAAWAFTTCSPTSSPWSRSP